jgi:hypothetical protein
MARGVRRKEDEIMDSNKTLRMFSFTFGLKIVIIALLLAQQAEGFQEDFSNTQLDPAWQVVQTVPGLGSYSLTDNPGNLRYNLVGYLAYSGGWVNNYSIGSWRPSMTLIRPFDGDNWILETQVTYNLHQRIGSSSTGAQGSNLYIVFGNGSKNYISIYRVVDYWYSASRLDMAIANSNGTPVSYYNDSLRAPDDTDKNEWLRYTYWYRVERNGEKVSIWLSYDGTTYEKITSLILPSTVEKTQRVIIDEALWNQAGSYADWDYIHITSTPTPPVPELPTFVLSGFGIISLLFFAHRKK